MQMVLEQLAVLNAKFEDSKNLTPTQKELARLENTRPNPPPEPRELAARPRPRRDHSPETLSGDESDVGPPRRLRERVVEPVVDRDRNHRNRAPRHRKRQPNEGSDYDEPRRAYRSRDRIDDEGSEYDEPPRRRAQPRPRVRADHRREAPDDLDDPYID
ncbi:PREDICTED: BUD13 homolog [Tarenaya hassleriana]|uniref:BUD13 homolog n=1 Tax=Tarenaya hassleriana TaxID=28532 RepID=UPI00053C82F7|nr:PREDICTED: BUD13 homolog [Tarenaya hassleriana]